MRFRIRKSARRCLRLLLWVESLFFVVYAFVTKEQTTMASVLIVLVALTGFAALVFDEVARHFDEREMKAMLKELEGKITSAADGSKAFTWFVG